MRAKGWKKIDSTPFQLSYPTSSVDGGDLLAEEEAWRKRDEIEKLEAAEEAFEEEEEDDGDSEADKECELVENTEGERTKLADGYYEIETVRRKRVRKGQVQYLIKWRGWPETGNTWEPMDNLMQCSDIIDAFEESLKAGKSRLTRKRKRRSSIAHVIPKKKEQLQRQHRSPPDVTYNMQPQVVRIEDPIPVPRLNNLSCTKENEESNTNGVNSVEISKKISENCVRTVSTTREEEKEQTDFDLRPCALKETIHMEVVDKIVITSQEDQLTRLDKPKYGLCKTDVLDLVQSGRWIGAKKRKSGSVKRFKKDPASCSVEDEQSAVVPVDVQYPDLHMNNMNCKNKYDSCTITQIVKPISYRASISNNVQDVLVAFEALRSDGTKVTVDNKFLKANNPLLLIDFYEKHLRYSPT